MNRLCYLIFILFLVGCGGGGGGTTSLPPLGQPNPAIVGVLEDLSNQATSMLVSDYVGQLPDDSRLYRADTSCRPTECRAYYRGFTVTHSLEDFSDLPRTMQFADLPEYQGISMGEGRGTYPVGPGDTDVMAFGGWMDYNFFIADQRRVIEGVVSGVDLTGLTYNYAHSIGIESGTNPTGEAVWTGAMVGHDVSRTSTFGSRLQGEATITYNIGHPVLNTVVDIHFDQIQDRETGQTYSDIYLLGIYVRDGSFDIDSDGQMIKGRFYGPNHEEVGGIFEQQEIIGAFGAKR